MSKVPNDLRYSKDHEWAKAESGLVRVGITEHAVAQLGDVTLVDLPKVGQAVKAGERFGDIESVKAVSELFAPVSGEVTEVHTDLANKPELVNEDPYTKGWMVVIRPSQSTELEALMTPSAYEEYLKTIDS